MIRRAPFQVMEYVPETVYCVMKRYGTRLPPRSVSRQWWEKGQTCQSGQRAIGNHQFWLFYIVLRLSSNYSRLYVYIYIIIIYFIYTYTVYIYIRYRQSSYKSDVFCTAQGWAPEARKILDALGETSILDPVAAHGLSWIWIPEAHPRLSTISRCFPSETMAFPFRFPMDIEGITRGITRGFQASTEPWNG